MNETDKNIYKLKSKVMKKLFTLLMVALVCISMTNCNRRIKDKLEELDDRVTALEDAVKKTNKDISALQSIVNALQNNVYVTNVITTSEGYTIQFSDGTSAVISNGQDGVNAPVISVRQDTDGFYYWTLDGEWLIVDGKKVRANGKDGVDGTNGINGKDAITPQVRINEDTKEWEISTDGGLTWIPTGVIAEGKDGIDGTNGTNGTNGINGTTPQISIKKDTDGNYYWTLDGEWILVDGVKVRANGFDGGSGSNGIAPQIRINLDTYEWEVSIDGGLTWESTGVKAQGVNGDSFFQSVDTSNPDYVIVTMADGNVILLARYNGSAPMFVIKNAPQLAQIEYGKTEVFEVEAENIAEYIINTPQGWKADYENNALTITAPTKDMCHFDKEGKIAITVISEAGMTSIVKINVFAGEWVQEIELRTLTFEDADAKFSPYDLDYCGAHISTWSDLIAADQYMDELIYSFSGEPYYWYDENNTELLHVFPYNYGTYAYWGGGHAISNYANWDFETYGDYNSQLTVYGEEGAGGHNGSANFCMHFGYADDSGYNGTEELPSFMFADGKERVIDHIWINNSTYALNCYVNGNGLTDPVGENDKAWVIARGFDENDEFVTESIFYLVDGPDGIVTEWTKWDLTSLGKVWRVEFNMAGTNDNGYGFSQPAYFAYDDVAVQFPGEKVFK